YMKRDDLPFYHALADAFTICDGYHASMLGPTQPNRLYLMTGSIDADGKFGEPVIPNGSSVRASRGASTRIGTTMVATPCAISRRTREARSARRCATMRCGCGRITSFCTISPPATCRR